MNEELTKSHISFFVFVFSPLPNEYDSKKYVDLQELIHLLEGRIHAVPHCFQHEI